ncbi:DUF4268 domain-containing protein [uncultured Maribacter sp.]|uniref:DUF4268 domain-containing protein n=1 Tax=uncultured Maribacter sp. TaxID=431308 RepID=UPI002631033F|nr:DUF4268 domain-containing protein [uncultured Maribacter sp.]
MFSKEESKRLKQDFWIAFGKSFPRKWILYNTKIKGLIFKFQFDLKTAEVAIIVDHNNLEIRMELWEKLITLQNIIKEEYLPSATFNDSYPINNDKEISKIYVEIKNVSIHNKNTWQETMVFLSDNMKKVENFFQEYKDILSV